MKECLVCGDCFEDDASGCPADGAYLRGAIRGSLVIDRRYLLQRQIAHGGMGAIYRARHLELERDVAIKLVRGAQSSIPEYHARFRVEAKALGRLDHPGIVRVTDFGVDPREGGIPYLVLELLDGETLAEALSSGPLPPGEAMPFLRQIATSLDHAHQLGVLHRDLKPSNVFLVAGSNGERSAKVLDFGLARLVGAPDVPGAPPAPGVSRAPAEAGLTDPEWILGTAGYISPEVVLGEAATAASDRHTFGVLMYETLVGKHPFADAVKGLPLLPSDTAPLPSTANPALPLELDAPLQLALEPDPARRPRTAIEAFENVANGWHRAEVGQWRRRERRGLARFSALIVLASMIAAASVSNIPMARRIESRLVDSRFLLVPPRAPDPRIIVISIDDISLEADPTPLSAQAESMGRMLDALFQAGARAVAIDILLPEAWSNSEPFSNAVLRGSDRLVLAALSNEDGSVTGGGVVKGAAAVALGPVRAARLFGFVNLEIDSDGVVRRMKGDYLDKDGSRRKSFARRAAEIFGAKGEGERGGGDSRLVDYSCDSTKIRRISWKDASGAIASNPKSFDGTVVLIGAEFAGSGDVFYPVPHPRGRPGQMSGVLLQAILVDGWLTGRRYSEPGMAGWGVAGGFAALLGASPFLWLIDRRRALIVSTAGQIALFAVSSLSLRGFGAAIPWCFPAGLSVVGALAAIVWRRTRPSAPRRRSRS